VDECQALAATVAVAVAVVGVNVASLRRAARAKRAPAHLYGALVVLFVTGGGGGGDGVGAAGDIALGGSGGEPRAWFRDAGIDAHLAEPVALDAAAQLEVESKT